MEIKFNDNELKQIEAQALQKVVADRVKAAVEDRAAKMEVELEAEGFNGTTEDLFKKYLERAVATPRTPKLLVPSH